MFLPLSCSDPCGQPCSPALSPFTCQAKVMSSIKGTAVHRRQGGESRRHRLPTVPLPPSLAGVGLGPSAGPCLCLLWGRPLTSLFPNVKSSSLTPFIGVVIPLSTDVNQKKMKTTHRLNWVNSNFYKPLQA